MTSVGEDVDVDVEFVLSFPNKQFALSNLKGFRFTNISELSSIVKKKITVFESWDLIFMWF